jgi:hypothetical protein
LRLDENASNAVNYRLVTDPVQSQPLTRPFDERSALEELERLADKIQLSRKHREEKVAEFDQFVRTFRHERYSTAIAAHEREARRADDRPTVAAAATHATRAAAPSVVVAPVPTAAAVKPIAPPAPWPAAVSSVDAAPALPATRARPRAAHVGVVLAGLAVVAVAALLWRDADAPVVQPRGPEPATAAATPPASAPATTAAPHAAAAVPSVTAGARPPATDPAAAPRPSRALNIEFVTIRPVWARITVDGRRAMEREFKADQRVPFGADRTIVIRAGDAGAIRLIVDGRDLGVLGRDGQVFDRVFTPK